MKIVFATGNKDKLREIREIMAPLGAEVISMKEAGFDEDIEENGTTFEENAMIKADTVAKWLKNNKTEYGSDTIVLADDSGLEIDHLNKEPGIMSARYMGHDTSYDIKNQNLIDRLEGVPDEKRTARFVCAIAAAFQDRKTEVVRGTMEGRIGYTIEGKNGFGYDPIFYLPEYGKTSAEISEEEKNAISHRGKALRAMQEKLVAIMKDSNASDYYKVIVVSDTHGRNNNYYQVLQDESDADLVIHCGDVEGTEDVLEAVSECPIKMVSGNNDFFSDLPKEQEFEIKGHKIWVTHGHQYLVSMGYENIIDEARDRGVDIVMYGHTHKPVATEEDGIYIFNPGSLSYPRQEGRLPSYLAIYFYNDGHISYKINYLSKY